MQSDYLISLIQKKYTLTGTEMAVVRSIFNGALERPVILFITNIEYRDGTYYGWSVNASNFFSFLNRESIYDYISGMEDCETVVQLKKSGCRKGVITEALKLAKRRMDNNI